MILSHTAAKTSTIILFLSSVWGENPQNSTIISFLNGVWLGHDQKAGLYIIGVSLFPGLFP
jgi:hypothetical protein